MKKTVISMLSIIGFSAVVLPVLAAPPMVAAPVQTPSSIQQKTAPSPAVNNASNLTNDQKQIQAELNKAIETQFSGKLSFPLDEAKMTAFTKLASRVKSINDKWDVLIAGAPTDKMAIEYNNMSVGEITAALKSNPNLTLDQYNELTRLTATNPEFNRIYAAYREVLSNVKAAAPAPVASPNLGLPIIVNGQVAQPAALPYGQPLSPATPQPATATQPMPVTRQNSTGTPQPTVPPVAATPGSASVNPAAIPANLGTAPTPQGSAMPRYLPPVSR